MNGTNQRRIFLIFDSYLVINRGIVKIVKTIKPSGLIIIDRVTIREEIIVPALVLNFIWINIPENVARQKSCVSSPAVDDRTKEQFIASIKQGNK